MESTDKPVALQVQRMKVTIVYESMFGNTHKVAQAISDGVREAHPDPRSKVLPSGTLRRS